jgi:hypothetical protein
MTTNKSTDLEQARMTMGMELLPFQRKYLTDAPFHALVDVHLALIQRLEEVERVRKAAEWFMQAPLDRDPARLRAALKSAAT